MNIRMNIKTLLPASLLAFLVATPAAGLVVIPPEDEVVMLVEMPLAVTQVVEVVPAPQVETLVYDLNTAAVPVADTVELLRYSPLELALADALSDDLDLDFDLGFDVDEPQPVVLLLVEDHLADGLVGAALADAVFVDLGTLGVPLVDRTVVRRIDRPRAVVPRAGFRPVAFRTVVLEPDYVLFTERDRRPRFDRTRVVRVLDRDRDGRLDRRVRRERLARLRDRDRDRIVERVAVVRDRDPDRIVVRERDRRDRDRDVRAVPPGHRRHGPGGPHPTPGHVRHHDGPNATPGHTRALPARDRDDDRRRAVVRRDRDDDRRRPAVRRGNDDGRGKGKAQARAARDDRGPGKARGNRGGGGDGKGKGKGKGKGGGHGHGRPHHV